MERISLTKLIKRFVIHRFNLRHHQAEEEEVIASITRNSDFIGANLWTLIFAILIASIGLNMNSTAVIIGAMLISPLMGPIMGLGLGVGTNNIDLVKKGTRNLLTATIISIGTSALYFWITPLDEAQSELLSRTTPTLWDVLIAFFGGLAGVVAATRSEKSNAIPGVAIATALMPPLCTAGYGLATGQIYFFLGAIYLYFINSIFICLSTFLIIRLMKFKRASFEDNGTERKVSRYILFTVLIAILPSIYLTYRIINKSLFEQAANRFVTEQFQYQNTMVLSKTFTYGSDSSQINLLLVGKELPATTVDSIEKRLAEYDLGNTKLIIRQGLSSRKEIDLSQIKASILQEVLNNDSVFVQKTPTVKDTFPDLRAEMKALYPNLQYYTLTRTVVRSTAENIPDDTLVLALVHFTKPMRLADRKRLEGWLKNRINVPDLKLVTE